MILSPDKYNEPNQISYKEAVYTNDKTSRVSRKIQLS